MLFRLSVRYEGLCSVTMWPVSLMSVASAASKPAARANQLCVWSCAERYVTAGQADIKRSVSCTCGYVPMIGCRLEIGKQSGLSCTVGKTARRCVGCTQIRARVDPRLASLPRVLLRRSREQQTDSSAPLCVNGGISLSGQGWLKLDREGECTSKDAGDTATTGSRTADRQCGSV